MFFSFLSSGRRQKELERNVLLFNLIDVAGVAAGDIKYYNELRGAIWERIQLFSKFGEKEEENKKPIDNAQDFFTGVLGGRR